MTTTRDGNSVRYGKINTELVTRWLTIEPTADGPFWALNLMKYREVADYGGDGPAVSGREADDEYTPRGPLEAIGAQIVFAADVERTLVGDGIAWDRIGIVRYPSRRKFFEMQQREDFKSKHVHKDAGMKFTIVMSCLPALPFEGAPNRHPFVELTVTSADLRPPIATPTATASFDVEGVIVGDERTWSRVTFRWLDNAPNANIQASDDPRSYVMLLRPSADRITRSVIEARA